MAQVGRISGPLLKSNLERQGIDLAFKDVSSSTPVLFLDVNNNRIGVNYNGTPLSDLYVPTSIQTSQAKIDNNAQFQNWTISPNGISIASGDINIAQPITGTVVDIVPSSVFKSGNLFVNKNPNNGRIRWGPGMFTVFGHTADAVGGIDNQVWLGENLNPGVPYVGFDTSLTGNTPTNTNYLKLTFPAGESNPAGTVAIMRLGSPFVTTGTPGVNAQYGFYYYLLYTNQANSENWNTDTIFCECATEITYSGPGGSLEPPVRLTGFGTGTTTEQFLAARDNNIGSVNNNDIVLDPAGTGTVEFNANTTVDGNIHATQNITSAGNLTLGSGAEDDIVIGAEFIVDLLPDATNTYKIGMPGKQFDEFYGNEITMSFLNGVAIKASGSPTPQPGSSTVQNLGLDIGNTFFVAQNGDDTDAGFHPAAPFRSIKRAIDAADSSTQGPVTIRVSAGSYEEITPLVVPSHVSIIGEDMRNTIVRPESAYQSNDIFLLEDNTTIMNLTVQDFYYDSGNDTGYAFRFNSQAKIATRSPYIQNVTVITKGTTTSASDPRGFASGDAGKGAIVDGAVLDVETDANQASMLFHSVTFITPGVDALTCKNGVRVEWLNCFTYFANIGINCQNGTGRTTPDSATKTGVELRSIASACVYGNTGIKGDGNNVLIYAINHNLAYIGTGKFVDNDPSRADQTQEVVKANSAQVYFTSQDHTGDFRVGDQFFIDLENGTTSLDITQAEFDNLNSLQITTGGSTTEITPTSINVGDFLLSGNKIQTLSSQFDLNSFGTGNQIKFLSNVDIPTLNLSGDLIINGDLTHQLGQIPNLTTVDTSTRNLIPGQDTTFNLGSDDFFTKKYFKSTSTSELNVNNIRFIDNKITTTVSNEDLEFLTNGTGRIYIPNNNVEITNNFVGNGNSTFQNLSLQNLNAAGGSTIIFGNDYTTDTYTTDGLSVQNDAQFEDIKIENNTLGTTLSNSNLELVSSGTGDVLFHNLTVTNNVNVDGILTFSDNNFTRITAKFDTGNIFIHENVIETTQSNSDLDLRSYTGKVKTENVNFTSPNGIGTETGDLTISTDSVIITNSTSNVRLPKGTTAQQSNIQGGLRYNTQTNIFEGYDTGWVGFNGIYSDDRTASVLAHPTNNTLLFSVAGVNQGTIDNSKITINGLQADEVLANGNTITSVNSNSDLELEASGNGYIFVDNVEFQRSKIIATTTNDNLTFSSTGDGYWKFGGTTGVVIPVVDDSGTEPGTQGQLRWNSLFGKLEVWTGSIWENGAGFIETVPLDEGQDINFEMNLILG